MDRGHGFGLCLIVLALLVLPIVVGCGVPHDTPTDRQRAEQVARASLEPYVPVGTLDRAQAEVRPSQAGWMVVFRHADVPCDEAHWAPHPCGIPVGTISTPTPSVFRDVFVCVSGDFRAGGSVGGSVNPLDNTDRCANQPPPVQPTATTGS